MLLATDIGNTSIAFGVYKNRELVAHFRLGTIKVRGVDEYAVFLTSLLAAKGIALGDIKAVIISSVVPPVLEIIREVCKESLEIDPLVIGENVDSGIHVLYIHLKRV